MPTSPAAAMILFDIDGTLVRKTGPQHRQALEQATLDLTGRRVTMDGIDTHGRLDHELIVEMLRNGGFDPEPHSATLPEVFTRAEELYETLCPPLHDRVCPGVPQLLEQLRAAEVPLALVTGNLARIGWRKIGNAGLGHHFRFGAFSPMGESRADLVRFAIRQAMELDLADERTQFTLIGDHYNDVEAARLAGVDCVAVATGGLTSAQLTAFGATTVVEDLTAWSWAGRR